MFSLNLLNLRGFNSLLKVLVLKMFYPEYVGKRVEMKGERGIIKYSGTLIHTVSNSKINPNDHWLGI